MLDAAAPDRAQEPWRTDLLCETHGHHGEQVIGRTLVTRQFKYTAYHHHDVDQHSAELYDLLRDPYQLRNLIRDPGYAEVSADLRARLRRWREQTNDLPAIRSAAAGGCDLD